MKLRLLDYIKCDTIVAIIETSTTLEYFYCRSRDSDDFAVVSQSVNELWNYGRKIVCDLLSVAACRTFCRGEISYQVSHKF